jgi:hypothetical protein
LESSDRQWFDPSAKQYEDRLCRLSQKQTALNGEPGAPAIQQSSNPAIQQTGNPEVRQTGLLATQFDLSFRLALWAECASEESPFQ